jgi:kinesin family protein C1
MVSSKPVPAPAKKKAPTTVQDWKNEYERVKAKGMEYKNECIALGEEKIQLTSEIERRISENEALGREIVVFKELEDNLKRKLSESSDEKERLLEKISQSEKTIQQLQDDLETARKEALGFNSEKYASQLHIQKLESQLESFNQVREELASKKLENETLKTDNKELSDSIGSLEKQLRDASRQVDFLQDELKVKLKELDSSRADLLKFEENQRRLQMKIDALSAAKAEVIKEKNTVETQKEELEKELCRVNAELRKSQQAFSSLELENTTLMQSKNNIQNEKSALELALEQSEREKSSLSGDLRRSNQRGQELDVEKSEALSKIEKLQTRLDQLETERECLGQEKGQVESRLESLQAELSRSEAVVHSKTNEIAVLVSENTFIKNQNETLESEKKSLMATCASLTERIQNLEQDMASLRGALDQERTEKVSISSKFETVQYGKTDVERKLSNLDADYSYAKQKIQELEEQLRKAREKVFDHDKERRKLHNTIMDLRGNIRVFCRVRPGNSSSGKDNAVEIKDEENLSLINRGFKTFKGLETKVLPFKYDRIYSPTSTQEEVFSDVDLMVQSALDGYRVCIFAYGQTGSGKSFTMEGPPEAANSEDFFESNPNRGVIPRSVEKIFDAIPALANSGWTYSCHVSFMEVYMEKVYDLLTSRQEVILANNGEQMVTQNLTVREVYDKHDVDCLLLEAKRRRSTSATNRNEHSSRSHFLFQMNICGTHTNGEKSMGMLTLVDLAGSENAKAAKDADQKEEGTQIRQSLLALQRVLKNLKQGSNAAFRESKLTLLLKDSLTGSAKVLMFLNISPEEECLDETKNSLSFGSEVNSIQVGVAKKMKA